MLTCDKFLHTITMFQVAGICSCKQSTGSCIKHLQLPKCTAALQAVSAQVLNIDTEALAQCDRAGALCRRQHLRLQQARVLAAPARPALLWGWVQV